MGKGNKFGLTVQMLLLAAVIFFGITLTNALDRNRREMAELRKTIAAMPRQAVTYTTQAPLAAKASEKSVPHLKTLSSRVILSLPKDKIVIGASPYLYFVLSSLFVLKIYSSTILSFPQSYLFSVKGIFAK